VFKRIKIIQLGLCLSAVLFSNSMFQAHALESGLQTGDTVPAFTLKDQDGKVQTLRSLSGPHGLLLLFSRSADWCGLCKSQLIDLESARHAFQAKGIRVASVTYDSPAVLKAFANRREIHFELLSDPDSHTIDSFGVRNPEATGYQSGIAIPNYFLIATDGTIIQRFVEGQPQERTTASYLFETVFGSGTAQPSSAVVVPDTPHLQVTVTQSDASVAPGARFRLSVRLVPGENEHLYAPGAETFGYHPIRLTLEPSDLYQSSAPLYGHSTLLEFASLKESVPVFETSTQIAQDVWAISGAKNVERFTQDPDLLVHGILEYQVCTPTTCFAPEKKPLSWTVRVLPGNFDRVRVDEALQRK
jgi:peroxiredoxin